MMTPSQRNQAYEPLLEFIADYNKREGCGPTYSEISRHQGKDSKGNAYKVVTEMVKAGLVTRIAGKPRSIRIKHANSRTK